jgi:hypothetical protein
MRAPASFGQLAPVVVPGLIVVGALGLLVTATPIGAMIFGGPWIFVLLSVAAGTLVAGYLTAGLAELFADRLGTWALPPGAHLSRRDPVIQLPARAVERAGFTAGQDPVLVPVEAAYALERSLAGAWGVPEDHWSRTAFLQRLTLALVLSVAFALAFMSGDVLVGEGLSRGMREHAGTVLFGGLVTAWLVARAVRRSRREAAVDLLADARAMVMDRGEHREIRRVLDDIGIELDEGEAAMGVPP